RARLPAQSEALFQRLALVSFEVAFEQRAPCAPRPPARAAAPPLASSLAPHLHASADCRSSYAHGAADHLPSHQTFPRRRSQNHLPSRATSTFPCRTAPDPICCSQLSRNPPLSALTTWAHSRTR